MKPKEAERNLQKAKETGYEAPQVILAPETHSCGPVMYSKVIMYREV